MWWRSFGTWTWARVRSHCLSGRGRTLCAGCVQGSWCVGPGLTREMLKGPMDCSWLMGHSPHQSCNTTQRQHNVSNTITTCFLLVLCGSVGKIGRLQHQGLWVWSCKLLWIKAFPKWEILSLIVSTYRIGTEQKPERMPVHVCATHWHHKWICSFGK